MRLARLAPHPATPCPAVTALDARITLRPDGGPSLVYTLAGRLADLCLPAPAEPMRADGLWRHACFEAFLMADDGPGYREFNFSPSGQWAAYAFSGYRSGSTDLPMPAPSLIFRTDADMLELVAELPSAAVPKATRLRLGLSAVIETADGGITYWALRHAPGKPDFHHTDAFALELDP